MDRIIAGVDFSPTSEHAATQAAELAQATGAELALVTATKGSKTQVVKAGADTWIINDTDVAHQKLEELARTLRRDRDGDLPITCAVLEGHADKAIVAEAERIGADLIIVGNKRVHGPSRVLGAVALDIVRHAPCDVYIVHTT